MEAINDWIFHPLSSLRQYQQRKRTEQLRRLRARYQVFRALLDDNHHAVELLTELGPALRSSSVWSRPLAHRTEELLEVSADLVEKLEHLTNGKSAGLSRRQEYLAGAIRQELAKLPHPEHLPFCLTLPEVSSDMLKSVGGKAATLARLLRLNIFSVPDGFVVPVSACRLFLENDDLYLRVVSRLRGAQKDKNGLPTRQTVDEIQALIQQTPVSRALRDSLAASSAAAFARGKGLAVRSSAISEDSATHSYAGQYVSVLNVVNLSQLEEAFKTVIASSFNLRNLAYRQHSGLSLYEFELAVLCLEMVDVRSAGILFTVDPNFNDSGTMLISAVQGLGELAVAGSEAADVYHPRRDGSGIGDMQIARKSQRLVSLDSGGVVEEKIDGAAASEAVLTEAEISGLVRLGLAAEEQLECPLDIEWAVDRTGEIIFLQARPLKISMSDNGLCGITTGKKPLISKGLVACGGCGAGEVRIIHSATDLEGLSDPPYVLVMHQSLVEAVGVLKQASAILVDLGNPADHLSCVAREYEIPMLTGLVDATVKLENGELVLANGEKGMVFPATPDEMEIHRKHHLQKSAHWDERQTLSENPTVADLYCHLVPLNLTDAYGPTFTIAECRSIHDLVRYAHEKAVLAMFEAGDDAVENSSGLIVHLDSSIPFHFSLIDLGGGLMENSGRYIGVEKVLSNPFLALWEGMLTPGLTWGPAEGGGAVGSVMSRFMTDHRSARPIGLPNYALVTRDFLNINARMDFHFTMIDTICGQNARLNYIKFRFKGGGTSLTQRCRRVRCLAEILSASGFFCDLREDLLTASIQGGTSLILGNKLIVIGRILGFSRLLDAAMHNDELVGKVAHAFLMGDYRLDTLKEELLPEEAQNNQA